MSVSVCEDVDVKRCLTGIQAIEKLTDGKNRGETSGAFRQRNKSELPWWYRDLQIIQILLFSLAEEAPTTGNKMDYQCERADQVLNITCSRVRPPWESYTVIITSSRFFLYHKWMWIQTVSQSHAYWYMQWCDFKMRSIEAQVIKDKTTCSWGVNCVPTMVTQTGCSVQKWLNMYYGKYF